MPLVEQDWLFFNDYDDAAGARDRVSGRTTGEREVLMKKDLGCVANANGHVIDLDDNRRVRMTQFSVTAVRPGHPKKVFLARRHETINTLFERVRAAAGFPATLTVNEVPL